MIGISDIQAARARVRDFIIQTPCVRSESFSEQSGSQTWFKFENLQRTGSFKERGALNKLLSLTEEERRRGIICASAGNHAQGVAYHAGRLGIPTTVVMPDRTPLIKASNTRSFGAEVILAGGSFDEAYTEARRLQEERDLVFVHPFDDDAIIAGQGSIGLELLEQTPGLEVVVVPIGGGGLISGIALALKETNPKIRVIGVEAAAFPSMKVSVEAGDLVSVPAGQTIADGIAVKRPGGSTLECVQRYVDEIVTVDEEEIANAILLLLEREKTVVEGSGAVSLAALLNGHLSGVEGKNVAMILSGGNIDVNLISRIIERGLVKGGRMARFVVKIEDRPGALARITGIVASQSANIIEIHHERAFGASNYGETEVLLTVETRGRSHVEELHRSLNDAGYTVVEES